MREKFRNRTMMVAPLRINKINHSAVAAKDPLLTIGNLNCLLHKITTVLTKIAIVSKVGSVLKELIKPNKTR